MRAFLVTAFILLGGTSLALGQTTGPNETHCVYKGMELSLDEVIEPCTRLLADPNLTKEQRVTALFVRGRAYHSVYQLEGAYQDYNARLELTPNDATVLAVRAGLFNWAGRPDLEYADLQRGLELEPSNTRVLNALCSFHNRNGKVHQALEFCSKSIAIDPTDTFSRLDRERVYLALNDLPRALEDADAGVKASAMPNNREDPNYFWARKPRDIRVVMLIERAKILEKSGERDRAMQDYNAAVALDRSAFARGKRAEFTEATDKVATMIDLKEAVRLEPDNALALYTLGRQFMGANQFDAALSALDRAIAIDSYFANAFWMRAHTHRALGESEEAVADMMQAIKIDNNILPQTIPALRAAGYWFSPERPTKLTPALADALRACMIDVKCN
jgi:tetratricopeptide (TPR) repeat protein